MEELTFEHEKKMDELTNNHERILDETKKEYDNQLNDKDTIISKRDQEIEDLKA